MSVNWDSKAIKGTPIGADEVLIIDTENARNQKRATLTSISSGETNTSSNVGTGEGLALAKVVFDLPFKTLLGETNRIILTGNTDDVTFTVGTDVILTNRNNVYDAGIKSSFLNDMTTAGIAILGSIGDPSALVSGDLWHNTVANRLFFRLVSVTHEFSFIDLAQTLTNKTLTTPVIGDFTSATHDHQAAAGGGQLDSTLALSDTANIAYLNTANTYSGGGTQNFAGATLDNVGVFISNAATPASVGAIRLGNNEIIAWDAVGAGQGSIEMNSSDEFEFNLPSGSPLALSLVRADWNFVNHINVGDLLMVERLQMKKDADVASPVGGIMTLGDFGNIFDITGTNTINEILATNWQDGSVIYLRFDGILTVTNNSGGTNDILTGDGANITTAAGLVLGLFFNGIDWEECFRNTVGGGGEVFTWTANHDANGNALEDPLFADPTDTSKLFDLSLSGMTTAITLTMATSQSTSQTLTIPNITGADILVTENFTQTLVGKTLTTPTIASFVNATHDHQAAAGGGQLDSTLALSDTANIAYLNQANTFGAFLNSFAGSTMRIPVSATPTIAVNGDIAIDTTITDFTTPLIRYFGTESMAVVAIPNAELTTPPDGGAVTYNATNDEFELVVPAGSGDMVLADVQTVTGAKTFLDGTFLLRNVANTFSVEFNNTVTAARVYELPDAAGTMVITGLASQITIGTEVTGASTALTDTADIAYLNQANTFGAFLNSFTGSTMRIPLSATPTMAVDGDFAIDTLVTDWSHGILKYFDGEELGVVVMPIAEFTTPLAGAVPTYNATNDEFEMVVPSGSGDMILASAQTNTGIKTFLDTTMKLRNVANTFDAFFVNTVTADRIITIPDSAGTMVITGLADQLTNTELTSGVFAKITGVGAQSQALNMNGQDIQMGAGEITVTSGAVGDILKHDATGFTRFPRGTGLQVLRVNAGGTDLEYATLAGGGDVVGPASSTDTGVARYDDTTGKLIKDSANVLIDDTNQHLNLTDTSIREIAFTRPETIADDIEIGHVNFRAFDGGAALDTYAQIRGVMAADTNTLEDGDLFLSVIFNGALTDFIKLGEDGTDTTGTGVLTELLSQKFTGIDLGFIQARLEILGDGTTIGTHSWQALDSLGSSVRIYADIGGIMEDDTTGVEEGSFAIGVMEGGTPDTTYMSFNSAANGLIQIAKVLDLNSNNLINFNVINSNATFISTIGSINMGVNERLGWRNNGNTNDNSIRFNTPDEFEILFDGVSGFRFSTLNGLVTVNNQIKMGTGILSFIDVNTSLTQVGTDLEIDVASGGSIEQRINNTIIGDLSETGFDLPVSGDTFSEQGTNISPIGVHDIPISATSMWLTTNTPATGPTLVNFATNDIDINIMQFTSTAADETVQFEIPLPRNYDNSTITIQYNWSFASGTGDVVWRTGAVAIGDNEAIDTAMTFHTDLVDTAGTANQLQQVTSATFTPGNTPADANAIHFEVMRQGSDTLDTFTGTARLHSIVVRITTDAAVAA